MNTKPILTLNALLLTLGMLLSAQALAQPVKVLSADPPGAEQGTINLDVTIGGQGFDNSARVKFLKSGTKQTGGIAVNESVTLGPETILANIDIAEDADLGDFDIEVRLNRGRGGKGTTLFAVSAKKTVFTCGEVFELTDDDNCDCLLTHPVNDALTIEEDCTTYETLVIPQMNGLTTKGSVLTAKGPFIGSTVIAAAGHRAHVYSAQIHIDSSVDAGCGPEQLQSAVGFVLHEHSASPEIPDRRKSEWRIWTSTISSDTTPMCHAIEFSRTPEYEILLATLPMPPETYDDWRVNIDNNVIMAGSYAQTGILSRGFKPLVDATQGGISITRNTIQPGLPGANAIQFGPIHGAGDIGRNLITASGGAGILILGDAALSSIAVDTNDVIGAATAVLVDDGIVDAFFKSNILDGDGVSDDIGICSDAVLGAYRANKIKKFDHAIVEFDEIFVDGCSSVADPAN